MLSEFFCTFESLVIIALTKIEDIVSQIFAVMSQNLCAEFYT